MKILSGNELVDQLGKVSDIFKIPSGVPNIYTDSTSLAIEDYGKIVAMDSAGSNNYTFLSASNMVSPYPLYHQVIILQAGTGLTTLVAGSGVTLVGVNGLVSMGQGSWLGAYQYSRDVWYAFGNLTL
jgi:hypothetical protein